MTRLTLPLLLIPLAALAAAAPVPDEAKAPVLYHATKVGTKWVYRHGDEEVTKTVTGVEARGAATVVTVEVSLRKEKVWSEQLAVSADGVALVGFDDVAFDRPAWLLRARVRVGDQWEAEYAGHSVAVRTTATARGEEAVAVPAGRFRALRVEAVTVGRPEPRTPRTSAVFYAPGVGVVREDVKTEAGVWVTTAVLKSFTPGKQ